MDGDGQQAAIEELLASRPCCLDEGFSTPLVQKLRFSDDPAKELATAPMQALLQQLRRRLVKATNMELECMLAEAKASVPPGKQAPLSERLVYLSRTRSCRQPRPREPVEPLGARSPLAPAPIQSITRGLSMGPDHDQPLESIAPRRFER